MFVSYESDVARGSGGAQGQAGLLEGVVAVEGARKRAHRLGEYQKLVNVLVSERVGKVVDRNADRAPLEHLVRLGRDRDLGHVDAGRIAGGGVARAQDSVVGGLLFLEGDEVERRLLEHGAVGREAKRRYLGLVAEADADLALVVDQALLVRVVGQVVEEVVL